MNIAIDARWIFKEISGIGNYTRQLLREISRMPLGHNVIAFFNDPEIEERTRAETGIAQASHMQTRCIPWGVFSPQSQLRLPGILKQERIRVFHSPNYMIPFFAFQRNAAGPIRCVTTIHDVIPLRFPDHAPKSKKARVMPLFRAVMREAGRRSSRVITVSNASRNDIIELINCQPSRVKVVYNGVADIFSAIDPPPQTPNRSSAFTLLYVGRSDPYKNIETLLRALALLRQREGLNVKLCIAGSPDPRYPEPITLTSELLIKDAVQWTGYLSDRALVDTYRHADLLVHPSRYEGFGLQIIEAMACGTPVLSSNAGSLPEVVGNAGRLVSPNDVEAYVREIKAILTTPGIIRKMRENGLKQAAKFTWADAAHKTMAIYLEASQEAVDL